MGKLAVLEDFKKKVDVEIEKYLDRVIAETKKRDAVMADAVRYVKKMVLASGKRLRPAFMYYGYPGGRRPGKGKNAENGGQHRTHSYFPIDS